MPHSRGLRRLLNEVGREKNVVVTPDVRSLTGGKATGWFSARTIGTAKSSVLNPAAPMKFTLPGYGLTVVALDF